MNDEKKIGGQIVSFIKASYSFIHFVYRNIK